MLVYICSMLRYLANFFSWVFQPLLMPIYGALLFLSLPFYAFTMLSEQVKLYVISCNILFTFIMPITLILLMYRMGMITSLQLEKREERKYPLIFSSVFYIANYYFLSKVHLPAPYLFFLLAGLFSLMLTLVITYYWKISMHMTGIGGLCGAFLLLSIVWPIDIRLLLAVLFLIAGITGTSRLLLQAHTPSQLAAGFAAGILPQLSLLLLV